VWGLWCAEGAQFNPADGRSSSTLEVHNQIQCVRADCSFVQTRRSGSVTASG
jgi:hypothetical protein